MGRDFRIGKLWTAFGLPARFTEWPSVAFQRLVTLNQASS